jgi:hypothetical protein
MPVLVLLSTQSLSPAADLKPLSAAIPPLPPHPYQANIGAATRDSNLLKWVQKKRFLTEGGLKDLAAILSKRKA